MFAVLPDNQDEETAQSDDLHQDEDPTVPQNQSPKIASIENKERGEKTPDVPKKQDEKITAVDNKKAGQKKTLKPPMKQG